MAADSETAGSETAGNERRVEMIKRIRQISQDLSLIEREHGQITSDVALEALNGLVDAFGAVDLGDCMDEVANALEAILELKRLQGRIEDAAAVLGKIEDLTIQL